VEYTIAGTFRGPASGQRPNALGPPAGYYRRQSGYGHHESLLYQDRVLTEATLTVTSAAGRPTTGTLAAGRTYEFDFELAADNNRFSPETGTATGLTRHYLDPPANRLRRSRTSLSRGRSESGLLCLDRRYRSTGLILARRLVLGTGLVPEQRDQP